LRAERRFHGAAGRLHLAGQECHLLQPDTFMNDSGRAVQALAAFYRIPAAHILVVHDELDLSPGTARLKAGGGHGGHNGLRSVVACLGSAEFRRLRLGIGHPGSAEQVTPYVLSRPAPADQEAIGAAIERALGVLPDLLAGRWDAAVRTLHAPLAVEG
jgi:peptidyl-tRNA hydrolase, PTH1 family